MSDQATNPYETLLKLIAQATPYPWYPTEFVAAMGGDRDKLDPPLDAMRLAGMIELTPWISGKGQGYALTAHGMRIVDSPRLLARVRAGQLPHPEERPTDNIDPALIGTTFGRGEIVRAALLGDVRPRLTIAILAINVVVFVVGLVIAMKAGGGGLLFGNAKAIELTGAVSGGHLLRGQWWRLLSSCFVHIGLIHLAFNMYSLWAVGRFSEQIWGRARYLAIYLISGLAGSCTAMWLNPNQSLAGASGALCGIAAALPAWMLLNRAYLPQQVVTRILSQMFVALLFTAMLSFMNGISWEAHLGGALAGAVVAIFQNFQRFSVGPVKWAAALLTVLVPVFCVSMVVRASRGDGRWERAGRNFEVDVFNDTLANSIQNARQQGRTAINRADELRQAKRPAANDLKAAMTLLQEAQATSKDARKAIDRAPAFESRRIRNLLLQADDALSKQTEVLELFEKCLEDLETCKGDEFEKIQVAYADMEEKWEGYRTLLRSTEP